MTDRNDDGDTRRGTGADREGGQRGPQRPEILEAQEERRRDASLDDAASYQAQPKRDMEERARVTETGTAARSERAAGLEAHTHHAEDARRAFDESEGVREPRPKGDAGGSNR